MPETQDTNKLFSNGLRIPYDEVFILGKDNEGFVGEVLGVSKNEYRFVADNSESAICGLKTLALHYIGNALFNLRVTERIVNGTPLYVASAHFAQVAVPIPEGEYTPINTPFQWNPPKEVPPAKFYFTFEEAEGNAENPPPNNYFCTLEEAKGSLIRKCFEEEKDWSKHATES